ncbi:hypothetical protein [Hymenobacter sp. B81]|uniref:hypothetical protein n=1 Tax=Hymenobacter sp. B81 TaxID=3344878 RepID=UPI0037DD213E
MPTPEETFAAIGTALPEAQPGQLFGKPCFKVGGRTFVCFFQQAMVFKLGDEAHREALALNQAQLFDPSGKGRPMKEWVQVPAAYREQWPALAAAAHAYAQE